MTKDSSQTRPTEANCHGQQKTSVFYILPTDGRNSFPFTYFFLRRTPKVEVVSVNGCVVKRWSTQVVGNHSGSFTISIIDQCEQALSR